ncbi:MAG: 3D domain-containing protein [Candidatus Nealsonbacteria bacterium]
MDIYSRIPDFSRNEIKFSFFLFVSLGILIIGIPFLNLAAQKSEGEESLLSSSPFAVIREAEFLLGENLFAQKKLLLLNENTLIPTSDPSGPEFKVVRKLPVVVTAYSSSVWETDETPYLTAAGTWVKDGIIANNYLSFGTKIRLPELYGEKIFVVEDRMNRKKGNYQIDIWFSSYFEAKEFGAKRTYIEVLEG